MWVMTVALPFDDERLQVSFVVRANPDTEQKQKYCVMFVPDQLDHH